MSFDLENTVVISDEEARATLDPANLRVIANKQPKDSDWVAIAYVEGENVRTVVAVGLGKNPKKLVKEVLAKALKLWDHPDANKRLAGK